MPRPQHSACCPLRSSRLGHLDAYSRFSLVKYVQRYPRCAFLRVSQSASSRLVSVVNVQISPSSARSGLGTAAGHRTAASRAPGWTCTVRRLAIADRSMAGRRGTRRLVRAERGEVQALEVHHA
jgi:hypothetical protein